MLILVFTLGLAMIGYGLWGWAGAGVGLILGGFIGAALTVWVEK